MSKRELEIESVEKMTADFVGEQIARLKEIFPECVTEDRVDFEKLRASLGEEVDSRPERYSFTWAGKRDSIRLLQTPSRATLVPCPQESVNFEETGNLFIEGDNLEVLKLLYKPYFGRVKMIYIDPPYNTGNDFIYPDNFVDPLDTYLRLTGQKDGNGNLLTSNPETSGRYHSAWLSMMYPRVFLARQLLREDGVICISIDDHEAHNLRQVLDEVFGEENFLAELVWEKGRKNDARLFSVGHEYLLVYARSLAGLRERGTVWREPKPGAREIWDQYLFLRQKYGEDDRAIERELTTWYKKLPEGHPAKGLSRYRHVDRFGPWRDRDISWPGGGGPRYEVIHPVTKQPCRVPDSGWRFASPKVMDKQIRLGLVVFREDHAEPPYRKAHLRPVPDELDPEDDSLPDGDDQETISVGMQVMPSVIYKQSQVAVKYVRRLMGASLFDNPKDHEVLARIIGYCTSGENDIIVDFFAGSAGAAEAVLQLNRERGGSRRFVMVQLPEPTPPDSTARRAGFQTIAEIGKERIRRVISKMKQEADGKLDLKTGETQEDLGFRVFKLAESNYRQWTGVEANDAEAYAQTMALFVDPLVDGWRPENVIWEVAIKEGYGLNSHIELVAGLEGNTVYRVTDPDKKQSFLICLDKLVDASLAGKLSLGREDLFVCRDAALNDESAANLALQCRLKTI